MRRPVPGRQEATVPATPPANCVIRGNPRSADPRRNTHEFTRNAACGHASVIHSRKPPMIRRQFAVAAIVIDLLLVIAAAASAQTPLAYRVEDIGTLGGTH